MDLREAIRARRMVRRFDPQRPVSAEVVLRIAELAIRAPSAGFSQGWDFVVLREPKARTRFWAAGADPEAATDGWLRGVSAAPVLILCCSDKGAYLRRYAEPDKAGQLLPDQSETHWPVPYWDVDTGMAAMLMLLGAVDEGLGGLFFGVPAPSLDAVRSAFDIPPDRNLVGVIALGYALSDAPSGSTRSRRKRPVAEVFHDGSFGSALLP